MKPLVIYHGNCQDGFTAAWACWRKHPDWEFYPAKHGDPPPDVTHRNVWMLDFSYKRPIIEDIMCKAQSLTILDHHKTAEADLKFPFACDPAGQSDVQITFDMEKSGARLAWEYFNIGERVPDLVKHVEDRDLWKFQYPDTKAFSAALFAEEYNFITWKLWHEKIEMQGVEWAVLAGESILRKQAKDVAELCQNKFRFNIGGHSVWVADLPYTLCSDAGNLMCQGEPFAATFYYDGKGYIFSLRSDDSGVDVSEIAKAYGGGGHKHAAGFKIVSDMIQLVH